MFPSRSSFIIFLQVALFEFIFEPVSIRGDWVEIPQAPFKKGVVSPITTKRFTEDIMALTTEPSRLESNKYIERFNYGFMDYDLSSDTSEASKYDNVSSSILHSRKNKPNIQIIRKENRKKIKPVDIISTPHPGLSITITPEDDGISITTSEEPEEILVGKQTSKDSILQDRKIMVNNVSQPNETMQLDQTKLKEKDSSIFSILKTVQDTISNNIHGSLKSKTRFLRDLRDKILILIEDGVEAAWPTSSVSSRSDKGHHIDFPSSESALMTISFLTFAVFLIKLVMQLIHAYKPNNMPVFTTVGKSDSFINGSRLHRRSTEDLEITKRILQSIELYKHNAET